MNERAFNLFTALVAALLLMLTVLLVNSMTQSERKTADTIAGIQSRSDLEAVAEMARTDAMQLFNFGLREKIEDWLTREDFGGVTLNLQDKSWEDIQRDFAESKFGGTNSEALAEFIKNHLILLFHGNVYFENYVISLESTDRLKAGLDAAIKKSVETGDFFTVIDCPNGDPKTCEKGTFYVNLHLEKLTQEEYESLPKLHVFDKISGKDLQVIILPRTTFRIYVPLRFFKAIAETRGLMHYPLVDQTDTADDQGLFSPRVHNLIEGIALGMCDYGYCAPRSNPFTPPENTAMLSGFCPGDNMAENYTKGVTIEIECPPNTGDWCHSGEKYNANDYQGSTDMKKAVQKIAKEKACDVIKKAEEAGYLDFNKEDKFSMVGSECGNAKAVEINVEALKSKKILNEDTVDKASGSSGYTGVFDASNCPYDSGSSTGRTGLYKTGGNVSSPNISFTDLGCSGDFGDTSATCAQVSSIKVTLAFKEEDPVYMVNKQGEKIYRITVYDNTFVPFTAAWDSGEMGSDCLYSRVPQKSSCSVERGKGWYCLSFIDRSKNEENGCMPA